MADVSDDVVTDSSDSGEEAAEQYDTGGLFPVIDIGDEDEDDDETEEYDTEYKSSLKWDFEKEDFVQDGSHKVVETDGRDAFATWCYKMALTERDECFSYPDEIGAELEYALSFEDVDTIEAMVERTLTEAIEVNPRTEYVSDFEFQWNGDEMHVTFTVKGIDWEEPFTVSV